MAGKRWIELIGLGRGWGWLGRNWVVSGTRWIDLGCSREIMDWTGSWQGKYGQRWCRNGLGCLGWLGWAKGKDAQNGG